VVIYVKLFSGTIRKGDSLELIHAGARMEALEVGCFRPKYDPIGIITEGEIGYVVTGLKTVAEAKVGDTLFHGSIEKKLPIDGFKKITPFVFA
jgi:GTP-binding protein LepA